MVTGGVLCIYVECREFFYYVVLITVEIGETGFKDWLVLLFFVVGLCYLLRLGY